MAHDVVTNTSEQRAADCVQASRSHHNQVCLLALRHINDPLARVLLLLALHLVVDLPQSKNNKLASCSSFPEIRHQTLIQEQLHTSQGRCVISHWS